MEISEWLTVWIKTRPYWEQLGFYWLLNGKDLTEEDYSQLVETCLHDSGIALKGPKKIKIDFPEKVTSLVDVDNEDIELVEISKIKGVNALIPGQKITFGKNLTAIFGRNAAGKSGYTRVLARTGLSRGFQNILPNVMDLSDRSNPIASITLSKNGIPNTIECNLNEADKILNHCYVFNNESVQAHLETANTMSFTPSELGILTKLAGLVDIVGGKIQEIIESKSQPKYFGNYFVGNSIVTELINSLSPDTKDEDVIALSTFGKEERERLEEVNSSFAELKIAEKNKAKNDLELIITELNRLKDNLNSFSLKLTGINKVNEVNETIMNLLDAEKLKQMVNLDSFKKKGLKHVGTLPWQNFVEAAHELSKNEDSNYPVVGSVCLFCQQNLDNESIRLIHNLWKHITNEAHAKYRRAEHSVETSKQYYMNLDLDFLSKSSIHYLYLDKHEQPLLTKVVGSIEILKNNRLKIITALSKKSVLEKLEIISPVANDIDSAIVKIKEKLVELDARRAAELAEKLSIEKTILEHKQQLNLHKVEILDYLKNLRWATKARVAIKINTRHISDKHDELFSKLVTNAYLHDFKNMMGELDRDISVSVQTKTIKGTALKQIVLNTNNKIVDEALPQDVLSDGEKRVVALVDFLTETRIGKANILVLDDPAVAMDLETKRTVAKLIVNESKTKQVIVFTHDMVFLHYLVEVAEEESVDLKHHWIQRGKKDNRPGYIFLDNSPAIETKYKNAERARELYSLAIQGGENQDMYLKQGFAALRSSYESFIVYELLGGVVIRFDERISFGRLKDVRPDQSLFDDVIERWKEIKKLLAGLNTSQSTSHVFPIT